MIISYFCVFSIADLASCLDPNILLVALYNCATIVIRHILKVVLCDTNCELHFGYMICDLESSFGPQYFYKTTTQYFHEKTTKYFRDQALQFAT